MGHVFYDIFSILIRMKFYLGHDSEKYSLQNGSFTYDIGVFC